MLRPHAATAALLLSAVIAGALDGCSRRGPLTCDEVALTSTIQDLEVERPAVGAEARAIDGIAAACPRLHPGLVDALRAPHADERSGALEYVGDRSLAAVRRQVCADPEAWAHEVPRAPPEGRALALHRACGFDRLGVLDEGEALLADDVAVLFVLAALARDGVDPALIRRLGRALMISVAPAAVARRRCAESPDFDGCLRYLDVLRIEVPATLPGRTSLQGAPRLILGLHGASWDGEPIADGDGPSTAELPGRLASAIRSWAAERRASDDASAPRLEIAVDGRLRYGALIEALRAAALAGVDDLAVLGRSRGALSSLPLATPRVWTGSDDHLGPAPPEVVIDGAVARLSAGGAPPSIVPLDALPALTALAGSIAGERRRGDVIVRATPTTTVEQLVAVLDALRGPECRIDVEGAEGCLLWLPILDQEPRLPRRPGRWSDLELVIGEVTLERDAPRRLTGDALRDELRPHLGDLTRCLRDDPVARAGMPVRLSILYGEVDGARAAFVFGNEQHASVPACVQDALGRPPLPGRAFPGHGSVDVEVIVPDEGGAE